MSMLSNPENYELLATVIVGDEEFYKYYLNEGLPEDNYTFWAANNSSLEIFYDDERLYHALDRILELESIQRKEAV